MRNSIKAAVHDGFTHIHIEGDNKILIQESAFNLRRSSISVAEATVMRNGIKAAVHAGFTHIHIEGDNKILIQAVKGHIHPP